MKVPRATLAAIVIVLLAAAAGLAAPERADASWRDWALGWQRQAKKERGKLVRCRTALGKQMPIRLKSAAQFETSEEYGRYCRNRARRWHDWNTYHLRKMRRPGGSGAARWWPLARYVGWPKAQRANLVRCVRGESGGRPGAKNGPYRGLMQITYGSYNPQKNLRKGYVMWRSRGWHPWGVMR